MIKNNIKLNSLRYNSLKKQKFKRYNSIGREEIKSANIVLRSGILSDFLASPGHKFCGGKFVKKFEEKLKKFYKVKHAIVVNSWTSGLVCAVGALDISPGDEIIVSPWTMCATATSILHWNAIPVFADIDPKTFCIDPKKVKEKITSRTKAIIAVDIFGQSADIDSLKKITKNKNIKIITDSAQSPYSFYKRKITGTLSDVGGYSLNYHKHINTGEGGIVVTNNANLAQRIRLIRNHAEASMKSNNKKVLSNMIGYNFRLGEIESAIGIEQIKKLKKLVRIRQKIANKIINGLKVLNGLILPKIRDNCTHSFYVLPLVLDLKILNKNRKKIFNELVNAGVPGLSEGYINLHMLPLFQNKIAYGKDGFPWTISNLKISYKKGICPIAEDLHENTFLSLELCLFDFKDYQVDLIIKAFHKVWRNLKVL